VVKDQTQKRHELTEKDEKRLLTLVIWSSWQDLNDSFDNANPLATVWRIRFTSSVRDREFRHSLDAVRCCLPNGQLSCLFVFHFFFHSSKFECSINLRSGDLILQNSEILSLAVCLRHSPILQPRHFPSGVVTERFNEQSISKVFRATVS
jgi:hypothetical protein